MLSKYHIYSNNESWSKAHVFISKSTNKEENKTKWNSLQLYCFFLFSPWIFHVIFLFFGSLETTPLPLNKKIEFDVVGSWVGGVYFIRSLWRMDVAVWERETNCNRCVKTSFLIDPPSSAEGYEVAFSK